ncbi:MAG: phage portal protein [Oscillospiraceae bacterium]|nr:phage portal protein [Oscillospiraceae bacterium]
MTLRNLLFGKTGDSAAAYELYSADIARWAEIYNGGGDWRYAKRGGLNGGTRRVAALNAARAVCSELARLCFSEGTTLISADGETQSLLQRVLRENSFDQRFPDFLEKVFALGGGVIKVYWDGGIKLDFVTADCFAPTAWDSRGIYGGAFGSRVFRNGKSFFLAETQELSAEGLVIENKLFTDDGRAAKLSDAFDNLAEKSVLSGAKRPLFVYFRAAGGRGKCPVLGSSVFAGAEDTLKALDIVFDSLNREFVLGKKRIIVPYYAVRGEYDENGEIKKYFDANDEVFQALSTTDNEELNIVDNTQTLRVEEHTEAISALLDLLCMQAGLSEGAICFSDGTLKTAAEVVSRNSRTYRTQSLYRRLIADGLSQLAESICMLAKMAGLLSEQASESAEVAFADGVSEDEGTRTDRAIKLYAAGLIGKERALSQIYGISLEQAKALSDEEMA